MKTKRHRVEFKTFQYHTIGNLSINWETVKHDFKTADFVTAITKVDKRLYNQYVDGVNIFELTELQYNRFIKLIHI